MGSMKNKLAKPSSERKLVLGKGRAITTLEVGRFFMAKLELSKTKCKLASCETTEVLSRTWREVQVLFQGFESNMSSGVVSLVSTDSSGKYQDLSLFPCFSK